MIDIGTDFDELFMYDFGPSLLDHCRPSPTKGCGNSDKISALVQRKWVNIQQRSLKHLDELKKAKVPVHDTKWIRKSFNANTAYLTAQSLLSADEQECFSSSGSIVKHTLSLWKKSGIPNMLAYGDLHEGNVAQPGSPGSNVVFFYWDSAFIGFPFLDTGDENFMGGHLFQNVDAYLHCLTGLSSLKIFEELAALQKQLRFMCVQYGK